MKAEKKGLKGPDGFENYYSNLFANRWPAIKESFLQEKDSVEYKVLGAEKSYFLDSASVFAALCLPLKNCDKILDLCAAPGGKTIVLASRMENQAFLYANERSSERKRRLDTVIKTCLPESISQRIKTSCSDGALWCKKESEVYQRILLDAPCSSERHVIVDPKYLNEWSAARIKTVSMEQWALLSCAYRLLEVGGILLYSTCALCPEENDNMIEKLYKKFNKNGDAFELLEACPHLQEISEFSKIELPSYEKTKYGYQILPDLQNGAGPIYFSIIKKKKSINLI